MAAEFGSMRTTRAVRSLRRLCEADADTLNIIANALDLPLEDGGVSFLVDAFALAATEIEVAIHAQRACLAKEKSDARD